MLESPKWWSYQNRYPKISWWQHDHRKSVLMVYLTRIGRVRTSFSCLQPFLSAQLSCLLIDFRYQPWSYVYACAEGLIWDSSQKWPCWSRRRGGLQLPFSGSCTVPLCLQAESASLSCFGDCSSQCYSIVIWDPASMLLTSSKRMGCWLEFRSGLGVRA